jgi:hypothetical protein
MFLEFLKAQSNVLEATAGSRVISMPGLMNFWDGFFQDPCQRKQPDTAAWHSL